MGLFKKRSDDPAEMERLRAEIATMATRIDDADTAKREFDDRMQILTDKVDLPPSTPTPLTPPVPAATRSDLDSVQAQMQRIIDRIDEIDTRITSISIELANQISELSGDIDGLDGSQPATDQAVDELRDAQTRLAKEQARYQIAFRWELAELADRLKRA